jgi:serine/threonine protein kinase
MKSDKKMSPTADMYETLSSLCDDDGIHEGREYISMDVIKNVVTKENIKAELGRTPGDGTPLEDRLADLVVENNARGVFAILVYTGQPWDIKKLLDDSLADEYLPLVRQKQELQSVPYPEKIFSVPKGWHRRQVDNFLDKQWMVLAPVFKISGQHMKLDPKCPLPFSKVNENIHNHGTVVYRAQLHPWHQQGFEVYDIFARPSRGITDQDQQAEARNLLVALKELTHEEVFKKEREILDRIKGLTDSNHIVHKYLATFEQGGRYYIIFPLAEGGDLGNFWKNNNTRPRTPQLSFWCLQQMLGLVGAVRALHNELVGDSNCRHGDLKPGNILHFLNNGEGTLKLTDFGISSIHEKDTFQRMGTPTIETATTRSYEAPEASPDLSKKEPRSRKYDIWSLGCIFLEFTIWLVRDLDAVVNFKKARTSNFSRNEEQAFFYEITNGTAQVHPEVIREITELKKLTQSKEDTALGHLLDLIKDCFLKVDVESRLSAAALCTRLEDIVEKAKFDTNFYSNNNLATTATQAGLASHFESMSVGAR